MVSGILTHPFLMLVRSIARWLSGISFQSTEAETAATLSPIFPNPTRTVYRMSSEELGPLPVNAASRSIGVLDNHQCLASCSVRLG
jgi:hypothetical protein